MMRKNTNTTFKKNTTGDLILFVIIVLITFLFFISSQIWS